MCDGAPGWGINCHFKTKATTANTMPTFVLLPLFKAIVLKHGTASKHDGCPITCREVYLIGEVWRDSHTNADFKWQVWSRVALLQNLESTRVIKSTSDSQNKLIINLTIQVLPSINPFSSLVSSLDSYKHGEMWAKHTKLVDFIVSQLICKYNIIRHFNILYYSL